MRTTKFIVTTWIKIQIHAHIHQAEIKMTKENKACWTNKIPLKKCKDDILEHWLFQGDHSKKKVIITKNNVKKADNEQGASQV